MRRTARAARANLRIWWPELICAALLLLIASAGQKDDPLFAGFVAITGAMFWSMGWRHRSRPLWEIIRGIDAKLDRALADEGDGEPVRHLHSV